MSTKNKLFKTAVFGAGGYVGSYLFKRFSDLNKSTIGFSRKNFPYFDLCNSNSWQFDKGIDYGIISAGITKISECENDPSRTSFVNVQQTIKLATYLIELGIVPIVFSSDYVFDGVCGGYSENSSTSAINEYGRQKELLEKELISKFSDRCIILRLSKVYGNEEAHNTFIREMLDLFEHRKFVKAAADQIFCPVHLEDVFNTISDLQKNGMTGLFNVCGPVAWQRYQLAEMIADTFGFDKNLIQKISLKNLGENFQRPFNTSMISNKLNLKNFSSVEGNIEKILKNYERKESVE